MYAINLKKTTYCLLFIFLLVFKFELAFANENSIPENTHSKYWISTGFLSYHSNRSANYNETNTGIGFEYHLDDKNVLAIGHYENSVRRQTTYLQYVYSPLKLGNVKIGAAVGIVNGYPLLRNGKFSPALLPVVSTTFRVFDRNVGFNTVYIPSVIPNVDGALAVQFKFALD